MLELVNNTWVAIRPESDWIVSWRPTEIMPWTTSILPNSSKIDDSPSYIYTTVTIPEGTKFGDHVLRISTSIGFRVDEDSVIVTLLVAGISESGRSEEEALDNLIWFLSDILEERRIDPKPLGRKLEKQIGILEEIFTYVPPNNEANG